MQSTDCMKINIITPILPFFLKSPLSTAQTNGNNSTFYLPPFKQCFQNTSVVKKSLFRLNHLVFPWNKPKPFLSVHFSHGIAWNWTFPAAHCPGRWLIQLCCKHTTVGSCLPAFILCKSFLYSWSDQTTTEDHQKTELYIENSTEIR